MDEPDGQDAPSPEGSAGSETQAVTPSATGDGGRGPGPGRTGYAPGDAGGSDGWQPATLYVRDRLLLSGWAVGGAANELSAVQEAIDAARLPLTAEVPRTGAELGASLGALQGELARMRDALWVTTVELVPSVPGYVVDANAVLASIRQVAPDVGELLSLCHVLVSAGDLGGVGGVWPGGGVFPGIGGVWPGGGGVWPGGGGVWPGGGAAEYGVPGRGGRMPVHLQAPKPHARELTCGRAPVVAMPDSGIGRHAWFDGDPTVQVGAEVLLPGAPNPIHIGGLNVDRTSGIAEPMDGSLAPLAGHGTFIAGLVRQACPEAHLLSIPVMGLDGVATEDVVRTSLFLLLLRHLLGHRIDVLSISLGFYPGPADTPSSLARLRALFEEFGRHGVAVVAGAGNDSTTAPMLPAAFSVASPGGELPPVPLVSVGALNPGGATVALFSNAGTWVTTFRCGASVVSTVPTNFDGGGQASQVGVNPPNWMGIRSTLDPDGYRCGFGVWSGTSFATPILAGEIASVLTAEETFGTKEQAETMVASAVAAVCAAQDAP